MRGAMFATLGLVTLALAGCSGDEDGYASSVTVNVGGTGTGTEIRTMWCGTEARVSSSFGGTGSMEVLVFDGEGEDVYDQSLSGSGGSHESQILQGEPGRWELRVIWEQGSGGAAVTLSC